MTLDNAQILQLIQLLPRKNFKTSKQLAKEYQVTSRTIWNYMKELRLILEENGALIETKPRYGIRLIVMDKQKFTSFINLMEKEQEQFPNSQEERVQYILDYLLVEREMFVTIDDLCEQLYVSRTTLSKDLKVVKQRLKEYNITLETKPKKGIKVSGKEFALRACIANISSKTLLKKLGYIDRTSGHKQIEIISKALNDIFSETDFTVSGIAYQNLISHLFIAIHRMQDSQADPVMNEEHFKKIKNDYGFEYDIAKKISKRIAEEFNIPFLKEETGYITIHLAGKKMLDRKQQQEDNIVISDENNQIVKKMLELIYEFFNIDFRNDLELRMSLALHLVPLKVRLFYDMNLQNPMLKEIKTRFTLAYTIAVQACSILQNRFNKDISENEIGYFALHFNLALERLQRNSDLKNVLIVCSSGRGTAELLSYRFESEFGRHLNHVETIDLHQLSKVDFKQFDYIISTVPIPFSVPLPILEINYFLEGMDIQAVKSLFSNVSNDSLRKYYDKNLFFTDIEFEKKEEVLQFMVRKMKEQKDLPEEFLESVLKREKQASTEFGNLVAIPHPERALSSETFVTVAILDKPIIWNRRKVQLIYLISIENKVNKDLQGFYKVTSRMLINKECVREIIKEKNFESMMETIQKVKKEIGGV